MVKEALSAGNLVSWGSSSRLEVRKRLKSSRRWQYCIEYGIKNKGTLFSEAIVDPFVTLYAHRFYLHGSRHPNPAAIDKLYRRSQAVARLHLYKLPERLDSEGHLERELRRLSHCWEPLLVWWRRHGRRGKGEEK